MQELDHRTNPYRPDLAASYLKGRVEAERYAVGRKKRITDSHVPLRANPHESDSIDSELLFGEDVIEYDCSTDGWSWVQNSADGYVGWLPTKSIASHLPEPTHSVFALRTFLYPEPELRSPILGLLSLGSKLSIAEEKVIRGTAYSILADGSAVIKKHVRPVGANSTDFVAVAEQFLGTPYLWGGRTSLGLDCSALVQLALNACGRDCPRDSDMQEESVGSRLDISGGIPSLIRGDLVYWKGHVGIMTNGETLLHANGHSMIVEKEYLSDVVKRISESDSGEITNIKRT